MKPLDIEIQGVGCTGEQECICVYLIVVCDFLFGESASANNGEKLWLP